MAETRGLKPGLGDGFLPRLAGSFIAGLCLALLISGMPRLLGFAVEEHPLSLRFIAGFALAFAVGAVSLREALR